MTETEAFQTPKRRNTIVGIVFTIFLLAIALYLFFGAYMDLREYNDSQDWTTTDGVVRVVAVRTLVDDDDVFYVPDIQYDYEVDNVIYENDRLSFDNRPYEQEENALEAAQEDYEVGQTVTVYYNPDDPEQAVLERTTNWSAVILLSAAGVGFVLFSILIGFSVYRSNQPVNNEETGG